MAQFLGDIAFLLELLAGAGGLLVLHRAASAEKPRLLQLAGWLLVAGGVGGAACTGYFWLRYQQQGGFDTAHPIGAMSGMPMGGMHLRGAPLHAEEE
jgi:hypothetical protein